MSLRHPVVARRPPSCARIPLYNLVAHSQPSCAHTPLYNLIARRQPNCAHVPLCKQVAQTFLSINRIAHRQPNCAHVPFCNQVARTLFFINKLRFINMFITSNRKLGNVCVCVLSTYIWLHVCVVAGCTHIPPDKPICTPLYFHS